MSALQHLAPNRDGDHRQHIIDQLSLQGGRVFNLICAGRNRKEIATELKMSPKTVDFYKAWICDLVRLEISSMKRLTYGFIRREFGVGKRGDGNDPHEQQCCDLVVTRATRMQKKVLRAFAKGYDPQEVAEQLRLSPKTVYYHTKKLLQYCREAWNTPPDKHIYYTFLQQKFADYFNHTE